MSDGPTIAWVTPSPFAGSGGLRTIVNAVNQLVVSGYRCTILEHAFPVGGDIESSADVFRNSYGLDASVKIENSLLSDSNFDAMVATSWQTAYYVRMRDVAHKVYFIQDYEPWFMPMGESYLSADATYRFGFSTLAIGRWLSRKISEVGQSPASYFNFGADLGNYRSLGIEREKAICVLYQPEKPRRCYRLLEAALETIHSYDKAIEIYCYGSTTNSSLPYVHNLGLLSVEECNELYNKCSVGLCCSASNPSRIPFEMMAAGLPVVDLYLENNLYDMPDEAVRLCPPDPLALASAVVSLLDDDVLREGMSEAGITFMSSRDISQETIEIATFFNEVLSGVQHSAQPIEKRYRCEPEQSRGELRARDNYFGDYANLKLISGDNYMVDVLMGDTVESDESLRVFIWSSADQSDAETIMCEQVAPSRFRAYFSTAAHPNRSGCYQLSLHIASERGIRVSGNCSIWIADSSSELTDGQREKLHALSSCSVVCGQNTITLTAVDGTGGIDNSPQAMPQKRKGVSLKRFFRR